MQQNLVIKLPQSFGLEQMTSSKIIKYSCFSSLDINNIISVAKNPHIHHLVMFLLVFFCQPSGEFILERNEIIWIFYSEKTL